MEALLRGSPSGRPQEEPLEVSFGYGGYEVTVDSRGLVHLVDGWGRCRDGLVHLVDGWGRRQDGLGVWT